MFFRSESVESSDSFIHRFGVYFFFLILCLFSFLVYRFRLKQPIYPVSSNPHPHHLSTPKSPTSFPLPSTIEQIERDTILEQHAAEIRRIRRAHQEEINIIKEKNRKIRAAKHFGFHVNSFLGQHPGRILEKFTNAYNNLHSILGDWDRKINYDSEMTDQLNHVWSYTGEMMTCVSSLSVSISSLCYY